LDGDKCDLSIPWFSRPGAAWVRRLAAGPPPALKPSGVTSRSLPPEGAASVRAPRRSGRKADGSILPRSDRFLLHTGSAGASGNARQGLRCRQRTPDDTPWLDPASGAPRAWRSPSGPGGRNGKSPRRLRPGFLAAAPRRAVAFPPTECLHRHRRAPGGGRALPSVPPRSPGSPTQWCRRAIPCPIVERSPAGGLPLRRDARCARR